jgi:hypothetical protein
MEPLNPNTNVLLLSSPTRFVGEYASEKLLITHAWPQFEGQSLPPATAEDPYTTYFYAVSFDSSLVTGDEDRPRLQPGQIVIRRGYRAFAERTCVVLSILFGKRFEHHGLFQGLGHYWMPELDRPSPRLLYGNAPFNNSPRVDYPVELNFAQFARLSGLLETGLAAKHDPDTDRFFAASRFYLRALRTVEDEPELSFMDLVTAGEVLAGAYEYTDDELFQRKTLAYFGRICEEMDGGQSVARFMRGQMRQIKKRYVLTLTRLLRPSIFAQVETESPWGTPLLMEPGSIGNRLGASYNLRSKYVHTGADLREWLLPFGNQTTEIIHGRPVMKDEELSRLLGRSPTWVGMERIIRCSILSFCSEKIPGSGFPEAEPSI